MPDEKPATAEDVASPEIPPTTAGDGPEPNSGEHGQGPPEGARASRPDDLLPPVEPPSAGFIVKLFLVPALIVSLVVFVVFTFNWLVHLGSNPHGYLDDMERGAANAWQRAHDFASELQGDPQLRKNSQVAGRVVRLLERHLAKPVNSSDEKTYSQEMEYRFFLTMALGQFEVPSGVPVLCRIAAMPATNENELLVRLAAIESLAVLTHNIRKNDPLFTDAGLLKLLLELSSLENEDEPMVRTRAAFALGVYGGEEATARLEAMTDAFREPAVEARFNAATGLARLGNEDSIPVLLEMIDPEQQFPAPSGTAPQQRTVHQQLIQANGLKATEQLLAANPTVDTASLRQAVQKLHESPGLPPHLKLKSQEVLNLLENR